MNYTVMKRAEQNSWRRSAILRVAISAGWLLCSLPAGAAPSSCQRELGTTEQTNYDPVQIGLEEARRRVELLKQNVGRWPDSP